MPAFVKALLTGSNNGSGPNCILNVGGGKTIAAGNTIFVAYHCSGGTAGVPTDNLGNTYTLVHSQPGQNNNNTAYLFRSNITNPGTLTSITVNNPNWPIASGLSVEFSDVGAIRGSATASGTTGAQAQIANAIPGGATNATAAYTAGDLWIGSFSEYGSGGGLTFATDTGNNAVASSEPIPEVILGNYSLGLLYYVSPSAASLARLAGKWQFSAYVSAVGAVFQGAIVAIVYNDAPSGRIAFTGTLVESLRRSNTCSGTLALNGTCIDKNGHGYTDAPVGALLLSGVVAAPSRTYTDARTGTLVLAGTCVSIHRRVYTDAPSGSITFSGTVVESRRTTFTDAPAGAIGITGTKTGSRRGIDNPAGRLAFGGTVVDAATFRQVVTGSIRAWGWAAETLPSGTPRPVGIPGAPVQGDRSFANPITQITLTPSTGTDYQIGDLLVCFALATGSGTLQPNSTPGWKQSNKLTGYGGSFSLLAKVAESQREASPALQFGASGANATFMAMVVAFRGLDASDLDAIADVVGVGNSLVGASVMAGGAPITTLSGNDLVFSMTYRVNVSGPVTPPAGFGLLIGMNLDTTGDDVTIGWAYQAKRLPGLVPGDPFMAGGSGQSFGLLVALKGVSAKTYTDAPVGTLVLSGAMDERKGKNDRPTGTVVFSGSCDEDWIPATITGTLPLTGSVQESSSRDSAPTGTLALAGTNGDVFGFFDEPDGAILFSGAAADDKLVADKCAGVLKLAGVVSQSLVVNVSPSGAIRLHGINSDFAVIEGAIYYDDFPGGFLEIAGKTVFVDYTPQPGRDGRVVLALDTGRVVRSLDAGRVVGNLPGRLTS